MLTLAPLSVKCAKFWLVAHRYHSNTLAKITAVSKQLPETLKRADYLNSTFDTLSRLIGLTKCIIEFKELAQSYIPEVSAATSYIPLATYWIVQSVATCASQISSPVDIGPGLVVIPPTSRLYSLIFSVHN